jgi:hypothetical protein
MATNLEAGDILFLAFLKHQFRHSSYLIFSNCVPLTRARQARREMPFNRTMFQWLTKAFRTWSRSFQR